MSDDGKAHFTYYDAERCISYVWDGDSMRIEVSHGGYGEPVIARIPTGRNMHSIQSPAMALFEFQSYLQSENNPFNIDTEVYPR